MGKDMGIVWLADVEAHDYPAAESYLRLLHPDVVAAGLVKNLRAAPMDSFKAKDIFRASQLSLLGVTPMCKRTVRKFKMAWRCRRCCWYAMPSTPGW